MKITKRVLAVLLLSALLISCLLFTVSAEEEGTFKVEGITEIEDIYEYYDLEHYVADDYENGVWGVFYSANSTDSEVVEDPTNSSNKVMKVTGVGKNNKYSVPISSDALVISFDIYYESDMSGEYTVDIKTVNDKDVEYRTFVSFLRFDAKNGKILNSVWDQSVNNGDGSFVISDYEGFTPESNKWHNVVIFLNAAENKYSFKISTDSRTTWHTSPEFELGNTKKFSCAELKARYEGREADNKISLYLDNVNAYNGTFERTPSLKNVVTAQTLLDLEALYLADATDSATRVRIAKVFDRIIHEYNYVPDYTPDDNTPPIEEIERVLAEIPRYINLAYAEELIARAGMIDKTEGYYPRVDFIEESFPYVSYMPADDQLSEAPGFVGDDELIAAIKEAKALLTAEKEDCAKVAQDSANFQIYMMDYDPDNTTYEYIKTFNDGVVVYTSVDYTYNEDVEGAGSYTMNQAKEAYDKFIAKYSKIADFVDGTNMMTEALATLPTSERGQSVYEIAYGQLARGFKLVEGAILEINEVVVEENPVPQLVIDLDLTFNEATIPDFARRNALYFDNKEAILAELAICDEFIDAMAKAADAIYYTARVNAFNRAKEIFESVDDQQRPEYKVRTEVDGVPEAIAAYDALEQYILTVNENAGKYVDAVENVVRVINDPNATFADKQAAIETAFALREEGNVTGAAGVTQANADLSKYSTYIETVIADSAALISLMAQYESANTFMERRVILAAAAKAAANCEKSLEGVASAFAAFEEYKALYNQEVAAMNATHVSANTNALTTAGAATNNDAVHRAADIANQYVQHVNK